MKPRLVAILLLIVLVPLALLAWLGLRLAHHEQETVERRFRDLLRGKLRDVDASIAALLEERQRRLLQLTDLQEPDAAALRRLAPEHPVVDQAFLLDPRHELVYPTPDGLPGERQFLYRTLEVFDDKRVFDRHGDQPADAAAPEAHGWHTWYWGRGVHILFWRRLPTGHVVGAELNRVRLMADIVGQLPDSDPLEPSLPEGRVALLDSRGQPIYLWGAYEPGEDEAPQASLPLSSPLQAWKLAYHASGAELEEAVGGGILLTLLAGLLAVGITLVGLAAYVYRETSREMREAAQRVNFVNQVSHELKTPLTNIRMYAELLESHLDGEAQRCSRYLDVIVSESQRLSRLIGNVLTFARQQRQALALRAAPGRVDDLVASVIEGFRPSLQAKGVDVDFRPAAPAEVRFDSDAVEQVLGNLFSNVEKYAAAGGSLRVTTEQDADRTTITVADSGPGVPRGKEQAIFEPFRRLSDRIDDGTAGTGIGLAISRDLARLHGGDLVLLPSGQGAVFRLTLHTPRAQGAAATDQREPG
ncbi:MAG: sensor histidine kinase [Candidatus Brocadiia bacterium]